MAKYIIIGNSAAAVGAVEGIRAVDKTGSITLIASEPHHTYSRPLISYLLEGKTDEQRMKYRSDDFYEKNAVKALLGKTVAAIHPDQKTVTLQGGETLPYEKLFIGAGSDPFIPRMEGLDQVEKAFHFMTLDDAKALSKALTPESKVLVVGAGLIGLKCAEGIHALCGSITVVDLAEHILPSILDKASAAVVQAHLEEKGLTFYLGQSVSSFQNGVAHLTKGDQVEYDVVVIAVGVRPNTALVGNAGGKVGRGITINGRGETSLPDVYAAGDCTEQYDISSGTTRPLAILPNAYMQGETCGENMAGGSASFDNALPVNAIGFFGLHMVTAGCCTGTCETVKTKDGFRKFFTENGLLKGFIIVGDVARAGIYTNLIREKTPLESLDFELIKKYPSLACFGRAYRDTVLGGKKA